MSILGAKTFTSNINKETSYGSNSMGVQSSTMELHSTDDPTYCFIEWDLPDLEETVTIGIWLEEKALSEYDGVFSLPIQAVELLREFGITVGEEFL